MNNMSKNKQPIKSLKICIISKKIALEAVSKLVLGGWG